MGHHALKRDLQPAGYVTPPYASVGRRAIACFTASTDDVELATRRWRVGS